MISRKLRILSLIAILSLLFASCDELFGTVDDPSNKDSSNNKDTPIADVWDATLDTAANVNYLTRIEKDVILEMNKVRTDPQEICGTVHATAPAVF